MCEGRSSNSSVERSWNSVTFNDTNHLQLFSPSCLHKLKQPLTWLNILVSDVEDDVLCQLFH